MPARSPVRSHHVLLALLALLAAALVLGTHGYGQKTADRARGPLPLTGPSYWHDATSRPAWRGVDAPEEGREVRAGEDR